jgi:DNA gyrase subunit B
MPDNSSKPTFDASKIELLPWYTAIRKRPKMWVLDVSVEGLSKTISKTLLLSLDPETVNAATEIQMTAHKDFSYFFEDNGRGVPIKITHRLYTESIFEILFAGSSSDGKDYKEFFERYGFLANWGAVLNALSEIFSIETTFNGVHSYIEFSRGQITTPFTELAEPGKKGTKILFKPDKEIWEDVALEPQMLLTSIQEAFKEFPNAHITLEEPSSVTERFRIRVGVHPSLRG